LYTFFHTVELYWDKDTKIADLLREEGPKQIERDTELAWQDHSLCAQTDPEAFFPEGGSSPRTRNAIRTCIGSCAVREQCLQYALNNDEKFGIWGGFTESQLQKIKTQGLTAIEAIAHQDEFISKKILKEMAA
jgi:WhiB family redox-sensing transcriptional regulator